MEASAQQQSPLSTFALGAANAHEISFEGPGLARLALMVNTVFERLVSVDDADERPPGPKLS